MDDPCEDASQENRNDYLSITGAANQQVISGTQGNHDHSSFFWMGGNFGNHGCPFDTSADLQ